MKLKQYDKETIDNAYHHVFSRLINSKHELDTFAKDRMNGLYADLSDEHVSSLGNYYIKQVLKFEYLLSLIK